MALLDQQNRKCNLSGLPLEVETFELDHIIPRCNGGSNTMENLQFLHRDINRMKGRLSQDRFIELCRAVVEHANGSLLGSS